MSNGLNRIYAWEDGGQWHLSRWPRAEKKPKISFATRDEVAKEILRRSDASTKVVWED